MFGILKRAGKVFTVAVSDCKKETLMARIAAAMVKGSVFYTDEFTSSNDLAQFGKHVPVNHQEAFADGPAHINGIEGFWSFAKRLYRQAPAHHPVRGADPTPTLGGRLGLDNC